MITTFLFSEHISQLPRHQSQARSEIRRKDRVWLGQLLFRSQGLCQLTPHFYIHCFLFVKRNIDLPGGQFNDPLLGKHFFLPFLAATPSSLSQTLEGLFRAEAGPFKGPRLASCVASETTEKQGHRLVCRAMCRGLSKNN